MAVHAAMLDRGSVSALASNTKGFSRVPLTLSKSTLLLCRNNWGASNFQNIMQARFIHFLSVINLILLVDDFNYLSGILKMYTLISYKFNF